MYIIQNSGLLRKYLKNQIYTTGKEVYMKLKWKRYLKLNYNTAIRAKTAYRPWGPSHNKTMIDFTITALLGYWLSTVVSNPTGVKLLLIISFINILLGLSYVGAYLMTHWYYVSALHYFETQLNNKEKKNE